MVGYSVVDGALVVVVGGDVVVVGEAVVVVGDVVVGVVAVVPGGVEPAAVVVGAGPDGRAVEVDVRGRTACSVVLGVGRTSGGLGRGMVAGVPTGSRVTPRMAAGVVDGTIRGAPSVSVVSGGGLAVSVAPVALRSDAPINTVSPT